MMPGARVAAAIEILDDIADGLAVEQALTRWARRSRFAGSKDRAAIRDYVFDVMRQYRTASHYGRGTTGRALMIGLLVEQGAELDHLFSGEGHAPTALTPEEQPDTKPPSQEDRWNLPVWLISEFETSLGATAFDVARTLQSRAPVSLRINAAKTTRDEASSMLKEAGIAVQKNALSPTALTVVDGARKVRNSIAFTEGFIELQDASSQAVVDLLPQGARVLDYCAGGGGKSLAIAAQANRSVFAHDIDPKRMSDIPTRAARGGAAIATLTSEALEGQQSFDIVLCDAPCSGSGAWRRSAEGKWTLTQERLNELNGIQDEILAKAAQHIAPGGTLVYATCSVLKQENLDRIEAFLAQYSEWTLEMAKQFNVTVDGDGFFTAHLTRA